MESDGFDEELLSAPKTLRDLVEKYKQKKISFDKEHGILDDDNNVTGTSIFDHLAFDIFLLLMAIISVVIIFLVIKLILKGEKMQALLTNLAIVKGAKAINEENETVTIVTLPISYLNKSS